MGFHLFAKTVYDKDLCFVRDLIELAGAIEEVTSVQIMRPIIMEIIKKHNLEEKLTEFGENGHYRIMDCYYTDNNKRMSCAYDMLNACNQIPFLTDNEKSHIRFKAIDCLKKWGFSHNEKIQLIKDCICPTDFSKEAEKIMVDMYLDIFN